MTGSRKRADDHSARQWADIETREAALDRLAANGIDARADVLDDMVEIGRRLGLIPSAEPADTPPFNVATAPAPRETPA